MGASGVDRPFGKFPKRGEDLTSATDTPTATDAVEVHPKFSRRLQYRRTGSGSTFKARRGEDNPMFGAHQVLKLSLRRGSDVGPCGHRGQMVWHQGLDER